MLVLLSLARHISISCVLVLIYGVFFQHGRGNQCSLKSVFIQGLSEDLKEKLAVVNPESLKGILALDIIV